MKRGKRMAAAVAAVDRERLYTPLEAMKLAKELAPANFDETVFERADEFDIQRNPNSHLAFGFGTHFCLGASLARLELRVFFEELLRRLPDIAPAHGAPRVDPAVLQALRAGDPAALADALRNDLQAAALSLRPDLADVLRTGEDAGALAGLLRLGVQVPQQIALCGCGGLEDGRFSWPSLTTLSFPLAEIARIALDDLQRRWEPGSRGGTMRPVGATLVRRESTLGFSAAGPTALNPGPARQAGGR